MNLTMWLGSRLLGSRRGGKGRSVFGFSTLALTLGVATLIVVVGIMNGFQRQTLDSLIDIQAWDLQIQVDGDGVELQRALEDAFPTIVTARFQDFSVLARGLRRNEVPATVRLIVSGDGTNSQRFVDALDIDPQILDRLPDRHGVMSRYLATRLGIREGEPFTVIGLPGSTASSVAGQQLVLRGYFSTRSQLVDSTMMFFMADHLDPGTPTLIGVHGSLASSREFRDTVMQLEPDAQLTAWDQYSPALVAALAVEKAMMILIVGLMYVVVAVNIGLGLKRAVIRRRGDLAVLRAMGMGKGRIRRVILAQGLAMGILGSALGVLIGILLVYNLQSIILGFDRLFSQGNSPLSLYMSYMDPLVYPGEAIGFALASIGASLFGAWRAVRPIETIEPGALLGNDN